MPRENLLSLLIVLTTCFVAGVAIRTRAGRSLTDRLEKSVFVRIPGYTLFRGLTQQLVGESQESTWRPALVEIEEALVPAFVIEELDDGRYTVFVPSVPTPFAGAVYILSRARSAVTFDKLPRTLLQFRRPLVMFRVWTALCAALALCFLLAATADAQRGGGPKARAVKNPVPATPASITAGRTAYNMNCRQCHGLRLKGDGPLAPKNPKPADLTDATWDHGSSDGELFAVIWNGAPEPMSEMKPMKDTLRDRDVWNIVNFIRSLGPKPAAKP